MTPPDTIFAVASGAGRAAIAVVRVSGPRAHAAVAALAGRVPEPRRATLARLRDPASGETLDHALVLVFEAAKSELGEDGAELHLHGSPAVVAAVLRVLAALPGLRRAEPGEFTRRAFLNGKLDLAQVEGLADLVDAETDLQRRQAQRQLSGVLRDATAPWRAALIAAAAECETAIDFAEDVAPYDTHARVVAFLTPVRAGLVAELATAGAAERVRDGVQVVIAGPANAGKSSLLNALARREAAIVSAIAGTTRDPIEVHFDLAGCPVTLIDTAGLRDSADAVERIGVLRARERAEAADLVLWLTDDGTPPPAFAATVWSIATKADLATSSPATRGRETARRAVEGAAAGSDLHECFAEHRIDDQGDRDGSPLHHSAGGPPPPLRGGGYPPLPFSTLTGRNLDTLLARLTDFAQRLAAPSGTGLIARARHREAFATALAALDRVTATPVPPIEIVAEDLRAARFALDRLIGAVDVDDILGDIFARFCIGNEAPRFT